jgi:hypothetical protein
MNPWGASERILLTLWVGGMWIVGYLVAPAIFSVLDSRPLAGELAGRLFRYLAYLGLGCGVSLLLLAWLHGGRQCWGAWRTWMLVTMLAITVLTAFLLIPHMDALRAALPADAAVDSPERQQFRQLHGLSSMLFLGNSLLGMILVVFGLLKRGRY